MISVSFREGAHGVDWIEIPTDWITFFRLALRYPVSQEAHQVEALVFGHRPKADSCRFGNYRKMYIMLCVCFISKLISLHIYIYTSIYYILL